MSPSSLSNIDPAAPALAPPSPPAPPALSPTLSWLVDRAGARPGLHSFLIAAAVTLAAAADPEHLATLAAAYIAQALEIVKQLGGWDRATAAAREYQGAPRGQRACASAPPPREAGRGFAATG